MNMIDLKNTEASTGWKPTAYLRFVEKSFTLRHPDPAANELYTHSEKTLQQLWINSDGRDEWRDVPFGE